MHVSLRSIFDCHLVSRRGYRLVWDIGTSSVLVTFRGHGNIVLKSEDVIIVIEEAASNFAWLQPAMAFVGVLVAALVAIWVAAWQHRQQVLQRARQDVADLLSQVDECVQDVRDAYSGQRQKPGGSKGDTWKGLAYKMQIVRLTAPFKIYDAAASVQSSLWQMEAAIGWGARRAETTGLGDMIVVKGDDYEEYWRSEFERSQREFEDARSRLVDICVHSTWLSRRWSNLISWRGRRKSLKALRKSGIEGCTDGPPMRDRPI